MNPYEILKINESKTYDEVKCYFYKVISRDYYTDKENVILLLNSWKYYKYHIFGSVKTKEELEKEFQEYFNNNIEIPSLYELVDDNGFDLLGVTIETPIKEAKKRFYELALLIHPDKGGNKEDMDVLYRAWKYVEHYLEMNDKKRIIDLEKMDKEFKTFCLEQEDKELPKFSELFENNPFTEIFNIEFEKTYTKPLFESGGYGHLYNEPDNLPSLLDVIVPYNGVKNIDGMRDNLIKSQIQTDYSDDKYCYDYYLAFVKNEMNSSNILLEKEINDKSIYERINLENNKKI